MNSQTLGKLLHIANSYPHCIGPREDFYEMKSQLLRWFGHSDGYDIQHFAGKGCFTCGGSETEQGCGIYTGYHSISGDRWQGTCNRCWGSGWHRRPRWIVLDRWNLGGFCFHTISQVHYEQPTRGVARRTISGFIEHRNGYSYRLEAKAHEILRRYYATFRFAFANKKTGLLTQSRLPCCTDPA